MTEKVYAIPLSCGARCIRQAARCLNDRLREHQMDAERAASNSQHPIVIHGRKCPGCAPNFAGTTAMGGHCDRVRIFNEVTDNETFQSLEVLQVPMYRCEFNTTELVWRKVKDYVATKSKLFTLQEVEWLLPDALVSETQEDWQNSCAHVERVEVLDKTREERHVCPGDTTCCKTPRGKCKCCPRASGVCCSDLTHCCPQGFTCDLGTQSCRRDPVYFFLGNVSMLPKFPSSWNQP
ncbi:hypothetical protein HPB47_016228 [Ixodes persulcatus]|uniref:Uncharacterized protein n=1 Tax=Ixodes persulcatus TaxID=34615 RepID=A0AC60QRH2_IXOPE|nr:hypothetical protein HPB47_016228 [Ixodes persulcatus]